MIYILHGSSLSSARSFIVGIHEKAETISSKKEILIEETSPEEFQNITSSVDMFGGSPLVILDITNYGRRDLNPYVEVLEKVPYDKALVIVLSGKKLRKSNVFIKNAKKLDARVKEFEQKDDSDIFNLVDRVFEGKRKASYKELQKLILMEKNEFYIFTMLAYGLRNLAYVVFSSPEYEKMHPYVKSKVKKQSMKFTKEDIKNLYKDFYDLDLKVKTGKIDSEILVPMAIEKVLTYV